MRVDQLVYSFTKTIGGVVAQVGDRIYGLELPQDVILPTIKILCLGDIGDLSHSGNSGRVEFRAQIDAYGPYTAAGYEIAAELAQELDGGFVGCDIVIGGVRLCAGQLVGRQRFTEIALDAYRVMSDYALEAHRI
jgi:hypothetical protein